MLKALIVDDESAARNVLRIMLEEHFPEIQIVDMAVNVSSAVIAIQKHQPDIVFLDINMPEQNGFQLLRRFNPPSFQVIFTTAYSEYALKAFEVSALAYLVKPLQISQLKIAVERAVEIGGRRDIDQQLGLLKETLEINHIRKIALPTMSGISFIKVDDIVYIAAEGSYTNIITNKGEKIVLSKKLKEFEYLLNEDIRFFRIHRSYIINTRYIEKYMKQNGSQVLLENKEILPVARERKHAFEELISTILIGPLPKL